METYQSWNKALAKYFLQGVAYDRSIYLSVDERTLDILGNQAFKTQPLNGSWREDLISAVRREVVKGDRVDLSLIQGNEEESDLPQCVAFLGTCVLAAYDMADGEEISDTNYFRRLRAVLKLGALDDSRLKGTLARPKGMMKAGSEVLLWKMWNRWVREQDFIPSAREGSSRRSKYTNFPISQCLLRQGDRDRLEKYFHEQKWRHSWDAQTLFSRLREGAKQFPEYLQNLIKESGDRYEVLMEAIHEVHQEWIEAGCPESDANTRRQHNFNPNLFAGLYRSEDEGEIEYYLYPKQKRQQQWDNIQVRYRGEIEELESDRPGWYLPIGEPLSPQNLDGGVRCEIITPEPLKTLQLPARDFWVLTLDPDEPNTNTYGTWRTTPELGQPFILLCKQNLLSDLERLRDEKLVNWSHQTQPFGERDTPWLELYKFMVLSQAWQGVFIKNWELKDALQPKVSLSLSPSGGLRTPNQKGWLQGYSPQITAFGFMPSVNLEVIQLPDEILLAKPKKIPTNKPQVLDLPNIGSYLIRATSGQKIAECFVRIVSWDRLNINSQSQQEITNLPNSHHLCGAFLT